MLLMTIFFLLFAMVAVGLCVGVLALIEVLFQLPLNRRTQSAAMSPRPAPVQFDLDTLRRASYAETLAQSA